MELPFAIMSPRTRRLHRGRPSTVLSNMTASNMSNMSLTSTGSPAITSADSSFDSIDSFGPSPDELVINARGRRALPLTFSPDVHATPPRGCMANNQRTMSKLARPNNGMARLLLPTRTSPRKRLTLSDSPPSIPMPSAILTPSPEMHHKLKRSPSSKKSKLDEFAVATLTPCNAVHEDLSTAVLLKGLSRAQLLDVINDLMTEKPEIESTVRKCLPKPDLSHMEERLNYLKRNIYKALPNTRLESKTDSLAFSRVSQHLVAFKKELVDQGKRLAEANAWSSLVDHSIMAWNFVLATPTWDNAPHNNIKKQCFKALAANLNIALKRGIWGSDLAISIKNK